MSSLIVPVTSISAVRPHPNADTLDVAQILGWQVVVKRGSFHSGDRVIYFPPDTVLPRETSDRFGVTQYLDRGGRIRAIKLRGEPSFGLAMPLEGDWLMGENVAEHYGATRWEPPLRPERGGRGGTGNPHALPHCELFPHYTEIENMRHFPDLFCGEQVVITEKIHGTNSRIGMIDGSWMAGSHKLRRGEGDALYWSPRKHAETLVSDLSKYHKQVILYGEIYGDEIQSLSYATRGYAGYAAFDLLLDGCYVSFPTFSALCSVYDVPRVPLLGIVPFDLAFVVSCAQGGICLGGSEHIREGVVVKPLVERHDPKIGRAILKYVSDDYLMAKKTDFTDI